jgi:hypothetical protein
VAPVDTPRAAPPASPSGQTALDNLGVPDPARSAAPAPQGSTTIIIMGSPMGGVPVSSGGVVAPGATDEADQTRTDVTGTTTSNGDPTLPGTGDQPGVPPTPGTPKNTQVPGTPSTPPGTSPPATGGGG